MTTFKNTLAYAQQLDAADGLRECRSLFHFPQHDGRDVIYFTGNSLGLQLKRSRDYVNEVMDDWAQLGVEGHFKADKPWWDYHERFASPLGKLMGALPSEVSVMNTLTVNLHLLLASFYQPTSQRFKIICEEKAFPSDQYMLQTQVAWHGLDPKVAIIEVKRREGSALIDEADILQAIAEAGDSLALVLWGGVNYYSGQVFDMARIAQAAHAVGAYAGFDLAHAAGNIALNLHDWDVDFAAWCSYKYMNAGPGNVSGYFIHEKHHASNLPRLAGWWGQIKNRRFLMEPEFSPEPGALGWQISNQSILALAPYLASVELFEEVGMDRIIEKRNHITAYLEFILLDIAEQTGAHFEIITPTDQKQRACQLSVYLHGQGRELFNYLMEQGVVPDWREPNVIRLAPAPLYCSYEDMYQFGQILKAGLVK